MSRLEDAEQRLAAAIERLERSAVAAPRSPDTAIVRQGLVDAQRRTTALEDRARKAADRLDDSIRKLKALVGD